MAEQDELLAAEEDYQRRKRLHSDDGWAEAQPDAGLPAPPPHAGDGAATTAGDAGGGEAPKKKARLSEEDKKRGNRMFGAMMGTLSRFKDDTAKTRQTEAAKRRQEVEQRLQQKLKAESEALQRKRDLEMEQKTLRQTVTRKAEEIGSLDEIYTTRHAAKISLANFLCTSPSLPPAADRYHASSILPSHPHSIPVGNATKYGATGGVGGRPVYWLPGKLTREQKEQIERQRKEVREVVRAQKDDWRDEKEEREATLAKDREHRDSRLAEIASERQTTIRSSDPPRPRRPSPDVKRPIDDDEMMRTKQEEEDVKMRLEVEERERSENVDVEMEGRGDEDAVEY